MFKHIICDLDGTLLTSSKTIDYATTLKLLELKRKGFKLTLCSGRHYYDMVSYIRELKLNDSDYVICCDGQYICKATGETIVNFPFLTKVDLTSIIKLTKCNILDFYTDKLDYKYISSNLKRIIYRMKLMLKKLIFVQNFKNHIVSECYISHNNIENIEKIVIYKKTNKDNFFFLENNYTVHKSSSNPNYLEITHKFVNKYNAIKVLKNILDLNLNETLYFGDDYNDYECFNNLKFTVTMRNAPKAIKDKAFYITSENDNQGVLNALNALL